MDEQPTLKKKNSVTLSSLIDQIQFAKIKSKKKKLSDSDSMSSNQSFESKQKCKVWTAEEEEFFQILIKNYGTDFSIFNMFFPKKTKNQIKNKYKQIHNIEKKQTKKYNAKLQAIKSLFLEADENEEDN